MAYTGLLHCTIGEETIFPFYFLLKINAENIKNTNKMYSEIKRIVHYKHNLNNVEILKLKGLAFRTKLNILFWNIKKYNTFIKCNNIVRSIYKNIN